MGLSKCVDDINSVNLNEMVETFEGPEKVLEQAVGVFCVWAVLLCAGVTTAEPPKVGPASAGRPTADARHVMVFKEPGRYGGWPANQGIWRWGDEIVVGFTAAWFKHAVNDHAVDRSKPFEKWQARKPGWRGNVGH